MVDSLANVCSLEAFGILFRILVLGGLKLNGDDDPPLSEDPEAGEVMVEVTGID